MIIVTGGAGFIGTNFILDWFNLSPSGCHEPVINIDKLSYASRLANLDCLKNNPNYFFVQADINQISVIQNIFFTYQPSAVVHFAAESHVDRSIADPEVFIQSNISGTFWLLEVTRKYWETLDQAKKDAFRFLHISTDEVFGSLEKNAPAFTEKSLYAPNSPYSASKASSDHLVRAYFHTYGLPVLTTHCSNNYGPYQFTEKLIPRLISHALAGRPLPIYGDGLQVRDWLYVTDHCSAVRCVLKQGIPGESYNIGGNTEKTNLEVVHNICEILNQLKPASQDYQHLIQFVPDRPGHDKRYAIDSSKIQKTLGWLPVESFETGLQKTVRWYLEHLA